MEIRLDPRSERLIERQLRAGRYHSPEEVIARALETLPEAEPVTEERHHAVREMLEFAEKNAFTLGEGLRIQDLIHESHRP